MSPNIHLFSKSGITSYLLSLGIDITRSSEKSLRFFARTLYSARGFPSRQNISHAPRDLSEGEELDQDRQREWPVRCFDAPQLIADVDDRQCDERRVDCLEHGPQKTGYARKLECRH